MPTTTAGDDLLPCHLRWWKRPPLGDSGPCRRAGAASGRHPRSAAADKVLENAGDVQYPADWRKFINLVRYDAMRFKGGAERLAKLGCTFQLTCAPCVPAVPVSGEGHAWYVKITLPDGIRTATAVSLTRPNTAADAAVHEAKKMLGID